MNFKKILATLVITISTWFSAGAAQAQLTNYDFSASISTGGSITAIFTADLSQVFGPAENAISPFVSVANFTVNGTPAVATYPYRRRAIAGLSLNAHSHCYFYNNRFK